MTATSYSLTFNKGMDYCNGFNIAWASNTTLTISPGQARDSTNTFDINSSATITLSASANGANALDTGTFAASTIYAIFVIYDVTNINPTATLMSLSQTAPYMPPGYGYFQRIGWWTSNASTNFAIINQSGDGLTRDYFYDTSVLVVNNLTTATQTPVSLSTAVPAVANIPVLLNASITPNAANDTLKVWPSGSGSTVTATIYGQVGSQITQEQLWIPAKIVSSAATIDYALSTASAHTSIWVAGFRDSI